MIHKNKPHSLMLSPLAFLKLSYYCHAADTEVGGFGISEVTDPLLVQDMVLIKQCSTIVTTELDDEAVADHIEQQALLGIPPNRCGRIWIHTHPGSSAAPSMTDEMTFERCFSGCDWSVMAILAKGGESYARLQINTGPGAQVRVPIEVDWAAWPKWAAEHAQELPHRVKHWQHTLETLVSEPPSAIPGGFSADSDLLEDLQWRDWIDAQLEAGFMEAMEVDD